jgi:hypothetical protein
LLAHRLPLHGRATLAGSDAVARSCRCCAGGSGCQASRECVRCACAECGAERGQSADNEMSLAA